jgi:hypothetical protein
MSNVYRPLGVESYGINPDGTVSYTTTGCDCCSNSGTQTTKATIRELEEAMEEMAAFIEVLKEVRA